MLHNPRPRSRLRAIFTYEPLIEWIAALWVACVLLALLWGFWTMAP